MDIRLDPETAAKMKAGFIADILENRDKMISCFKNNETEKMMEHVHQIHGSAGILELAEIRDDAKELEDLYLHKKEVKGQIKKFIKKLNKLR